MNCCKDLDCCGINYKYRLEQISDEVCELIVTPCLMPTAVYNVATIRCKHNTCTSFDYYQAQVNVDPCICIQDCNLCDLIERAICLYINDLPVANCNRRNSMFNF